MDDKQPPEDEIGSATLTSGPLEDRYQMYLYYADDGTGHDLTRRGAPLKTFEEWLQS